MLQRGLFRGVLALLLITGTAHGQPRRRCPAGTTITADTAGHCCWPGQVWSSVSRTCRGIPTCPPGSIARGEGCAALESGSQGTPIETEARAPSTPSLSAGTSIAPSPLVMPPATRTVRPLWRLGVAGASILGAAVLTGAVFSVVLAARTDYDDCRSAALLMQIPLVGPAVGGINYESQSFYTYNGGFPYTFHCNDDDGVGAFGVIDSVAQVAGLTMMIVGFAVKRTEPLTAADRSPTVFVTPGLVGSGAGLNLNVIHF